MNADKGKHFLIEVHLRSSAANNALLSPGGTSSNWHNTVIHL
jgi:hypothetical protein